MVSKTAVILCVDVPLNLNLLLAKKLHENYNAEVLSLSLSRVVSYKIKMILSKDIFKKKDVLTLK